MKQKYKTKKQKVGLNWPQKRWGLKEALTKQPLLHHRKHPVMMPLSQENHIFLQIYIDSQLSSHELSDFSRQNLRYLETLEASSNIFFFIVKVMFERL